MKTVASIKYYVFSMKCRLKTIFKNYIYQIQHTKYQIPSSGFTLVELLVVIGIITMITALLFPNFMGARQRARDSQRKADLKQIQGAVELYKLDQNPPAYPSGNFAGTMCRRCWSAAGSSDVCPTGSNVYMNKFSCDPGSNNPTPYIYTRDAGNILSYSLTGCLENLVDPDRDPTPVAACATPGYASYTVNEP